MATLNRVTLIGRLGRDPETKQTTTGKAVCKFAIATEDFAGAGKEPGTTWHTIVAWEKLAELCAEHLSKGKLVYVEGRLSVRSYDKDGEKRYFTEIVANGVQFLSPRDAATSSERAPHPEPVDSDVPF